MYQAERGLFELRRRRALFVCDGDPRTGRGVLAAAVEGLEDRTLRRLRQLGAGPVDLVVTAHRARALGLDGPAGQGDAGANGRGAGSPQGAQALLADSKAVSSANGRDAHPNGASSAANGRDTGSRGSHSGVNGTHSHDAGQPVAIRLGADPSPSDVLALCSAPGRFGVAGSLRPALPAETCALGLARLGHLLPAVVSVAVGDDRTRLDEALESGEVLSVSTPEVSAALATPRLAVSHVSDAPVPLQGAEGARFILFREENSLLEHVAILIGTREDWPEAVPVRLHSACLTGDLFGSLKCDCGEQLRGSLGHFRERGGGVLLYLAQEGRGIGLGNKLRAYALQDGGLDTIDADCSLGFGADERSYDAALDMLRYLGIERVQLLTNNPEKVRAMERGGIEVVDRRPLHGTLNRYNLPYVRAKVHRAGHWLGDMLSGVSENGS